MPKEDYTLETTKDDEGNVVKVVVKMAKKAAKKAEEK